MEIKKYTFEYDDQVMDLIKDEGEEWLCYWADENQTKYRHALRNSITYIALEEEEVCGFIRALDDMGFYIYICDLFVTRKHRGKHIGKQLMDRLVEDFSEQVIYVMSDVDEYYQKLGYPIVGSVLEVQ
ncbi:MAG: GNAT family N-acetyltransferase [Firmicutes bacterium HGW-Firmicutes-20]|nr:MAG: GNAT family N-acetyltransferase [Firmicutes bacterium HGW-Firmicutes-20]